MGRTKGSKNKPKEPVYVGKPAEVLWDLKKGDQILATTSGEKLETKQRVITFDHVDGMYSYNTLPNGEVIHIRNSAPVRKVGKYYRLLDDDGNIIE